MMKSCEWHAGSLLRKPRRPNSSLMKTPSENSMLLAPSQGSPSSLTPPTGLRLTKFQKVVLGLALIVSAVLLTLSVFLHVNGSKLFLRPSMLDSPVLVSTPILSTWMIPPTTTSVLSGMANNV